MSSAKSTQDAKKDEFRKYLEKAGVLELLTKSFVQPALLSQFFVTCTAVGNVAWGYSCGSSGSRQLKVDKKRVGKWIGKEKKNLQS